MNGLFLSMHGLHERISLFPLLLREDKSSISEVFLSRQELWLLRNGLSVRTRCFMGHRTKRFFQWSGKMGERLWEPNGLGMFGKMGWIFRSGFSLYMGLHLLYVWGAFPRNFGRLLYIGLADGAKTSWKGFIFGCVAVLWLGWWILLYDGVSGCVAVFCAYFKI